MKRRDMDNLSLHLSHIPLGFQRSGKILSTADHVLVHFADAISASSDCVSLNGRDTAAVTLDTARVAAVAVLVLEARWWGKIEAGKGTGFTESVTGVWS